jgi:hypothetical protein
MPAPFAPQLVSPPMRGAAPATAVSLRFRHMGSTPGQAMEGYQLRRRTLSPSPGAYSYWNGSSWVGGETWVTAAAADRAEVTLATGAWTANTTWEWGVRTRDSALDASTWSTPGVVLTNTAPSLTVSLAAATVTSARPRFTWVFSGGTGRTQREVQFSVYTLATTQLTGFDASDPSWPYLWRSDPMFSGTKFSSQVEADLPTGGTFRIYGRVVDDTGLGGTWALLGQFTTDYVPPAAPIVTATPEDDGTVTLDVRSAFNLLSADSAAFGGSIGDWSPVTAAMLSWDVSQRMRVLFSGATYAELDTKYTTFAAEDSALGTFEDQRQDRATPNTEISTTQGLGGVLVSPSTVYSAVATVRAISRQVPCIIHIYWYNSAGTYLSRSSGGTIQALIGQDTNVFVDSASSPATAARAAIRLEFVSPGNAMDEHVFVDNVALAATSSVTWSPGGATTGLGFVVQRREDSGPWEYVWDASHDDPAGAEGQGQDRVLLRDRAVHLSKKPIEYRAFALGDAFTNPRYSLPTTVTLPNGLNLERWYLRCYDSPDCDLRIHAEGFDMSEDTHTEVLLPAGGAVPLVLNEALPRKREVQMSFLLQNPTDAARFQNIVKGRGLVYLQRNVGEGFFFKIIGRVAFRQIAQRTVSGVTEMHKVSFTGMRLS